jgi:inverted formin-2
MILTPLLSFQIILLDGKKSLNVNIFLKQFRRYAKRLLNIHAQYLWLFCSSHEDIVKLVRDVHPDDIGAERLRTLLRLLPEMDELEMLTSFDGEKSRLGTAEAFLIRLVQVPKYLHQNAVIARLDIYFIFSYKLRIESMLLKEEFTTNMSYLEPSISAMIVAGEGIFSKI